MLSKHKKAIEFLGLPLTVGEIDLVDRKRNYVGERKSEVKVNKRSFVIIFLHNG